MAVDKEFSFDNLDNARNYAKGAPRNALPGYDMMHRMAAQVLAETAGEGAEILVVGAGGGLEVAAFAAHRNNWSFVAVDPSAPMIQAAQETLGETAKRAEWIIDTVDAAPKRLVDGAVCLLTLHMIPDDGSKLETLKAIKARLKPNSRFVLVDQCLTDDEKRPMRARRYSDFFIESGTPVEIVEGITETVLQSETMATEEREVQLLQEAGFKDIDLIFAGFAWRGWAAIA